jgi:hypothetical protein
MLKITVSLSDEHIEKIEKFQLEMRSTDSSQEGFDRFLDAAKDIAPILSGSYNHHISQAAKNAG